jgi:hypothetical protein
MKETLANGAEILRDRVNGIGIEIGLIQTEPEGQPEGWLYWLEGQSLVSQREWRHCSKAQALEQLAIWLSLSGMTVQGENIVPSE